MSLDIDKYGLMQSAPQGKMPKILGVPALIAEKIKGKLSDRSLVFSFSFLSSLSVSLSLDNLSPESLDLPLSLPIFLSKWPFMVSYFTTRSVWE